MNSRRYSDLDPRTELEQQVAADLKAALAKRDVEVWHHGKASANAPSTAPAAITLDWTTQRKNYRLLVEVAQRRNDSEYAALVEHVDRAVAVNASSTTHVLVCRSSDILPSRSPHTQRESAESEQ